MGIITINSDFIKEFYSSIEEILNIIESRIENQKPVLDGERLLTGEAVCKILNISKRTLQDYRDNGIISFIQLPGKIIYKESDLWALLEKNYCRSFK